MTLGKFSGDPQTVWLTEQGVPDRNMSVVKDFIFTDPDGKAWKTPKDSVVNGASIPRVLWTLIGSPYTGDYRRASIVHDVACDEAGKNKKKRSAADRMFFHACLAGDCSWREAIILYIGVRIGAILPDVDTWHAAGAVESAGPRIARTDGEYQLERDFSSICEYVLAYGTTNNPFELEARFDKALFVVTGVVFKDGKNLKAKKER